MGGLLRLVITKSLASERERCHLRGTALAEYVCDGVPALAPLA